MGIPYEVVQNWSPSPNIFIHSSIYWRVPLQNVIADKGLLIKAKHVIRTVNVRNCIGCSQSQVTIWNNIFRTDNVNKMGNEIFLPVAGQTWHITQGGNIYKGLTGVATWCLLNGGLLHLLCTYCNQYMWLVYKAAF